MLEYIYNFGRSTETEQEKYSQPRNMPSRQTATLLLRRPSIMGRNIRRRLSQVSQTNDSEVSFSQFSHTTNLQSGSIEGKPSLWIIVSRQGVYSTN